MNHKIPQYIQQINRLYLEGLEIELALHPANNEHVEITVRQSKESPHQGLIETPDGPIEECYFVVDKSTKFAILRDTLTTYQSEPSPTLTYGQRMRIEEATGIVLHESQRTYTDEDNDTWALAWVRI